MAIIEISSLEELQLIGNDIAYPANGDYELVEDIDGAGEASFTPLCSSEGNPFTGTFDGKKHTISNLTIPISGINPRGLFAYVADGGQISNVIIEDSSVVGYQAGMVVGKVTKTTSGLSPSGITNVLCRRCSVRGTTSAGGILGITNTAYLPPYDGLSTVLLNCSHFRNGTVNTVSTSVIGGVVGSASDSSLQKCSAVDVELSCSATYKAYAGGIFGEGSEQPNRLVLAQDCFFRGSINCPNANSRAGGISGRIGYALVDILRITRCYSVVTATSPVIGNTGELPSVQQTYWESLFYRSGENITDDPINESLPKTDGELKEVSLYSSWDSVDTWTLVEGTYPELQCSILVEPIQYTVSVETDPESGGSATVNGGTSVTADEGTVLTFSQTPAEGYTFVGWYKDDVLIETLPETLTEDATYVAVYKLTPEPEPESTYIPNPMLQIRWRDDNKGKWSAYRTIPLGVEGETDIFRRLFKLGQYKARQYEIVVSSSVPVTISSIYEYLKGSGENDGS